MGGTPAIRISSAEVGPTAAIRVQQSAKLMSFASLCFFHTFRQASPKPICCQVFSCCLSSPIIRAGRFSFQFTQSSFGAAVMLPVLYP